MILCYTNLDAGDYLLAPQAGSVQARSGGHEKVITKHGKYRKTRDKNQWVLKLKFWPRELREAAWCTIMRLKYYGENQQGEQTSQECKLKGKLSVGAGGVVGVWREMGDITFEELDFCS